MGNYGVITVNFIFDERINTDDINGDVSYWNVELHRRSDGEIRHKVLKIETHFFGARTETTYSIQNMIREFEEVAFYDVRETNDGPVNGYAESWGPVSLEDHEELSTFGMAQALFEDYVWS